jgi:hypothetical protein
MALANSMVVEVIELDGAAHILSLSLPHSCSSWLLAAVGEPRRRWSTGPAGRKGGGVGEACEAAEEVAGLVEAARGGGGGGGTGDGGGERWWSWATVTQGSAAVARLYRHANDRMRRGERRSDGKKVKDEEIKEREKENGKIKNEYEKKTSVL